jgi:chromatin remodeling complex protein RSC6
MSSDARNILCDDVLHDLLGDVTDLTYFNLQRYMNTHFVV